MTKRNFRKFRKFANFGKKTENFQKIITFFATVENLIYIVYSILRQVSIVGKNKIFRHSVHFRDIEKIRFYLVKFWVKFFFIFSQESYFPYGVVHDVRRIFNRSKKSYDFLKVGKKFQFFVEIR